MWWSRKRRQTQMGAKDPWRDRLSSEINQYVVSKQRRLACFLNQKTQGLSAKGKKLLLVGFCLAFGGMSLFLILHTLLGSPSVSPALQPGSISIPQHVDKTGEEGLYPGALVTEEDIINIRQFRYYMDSLQHSADGKIIYDSILMARPRLLDTVSMLEQLYLLQQKKVSYGKQSAFRKITETEKISFNASSSHHSFYNYGVCCFRRR